MLDRLKISIKNNKKKILAAVSLLAAGYFLYKYIDEDNSVVKISTFLEAVKEN